MHDVAYVSPKTVNKTRAKGSTIAKGDDVDLSKSIVRGLVILDTIRTKTPLEQFEKLKKDGTIYITFLVP